MRFEHSVYWILDRFSVDSVVKTNEWRTIRASILVYLYSFSALRLVQKNCGSSLELAAAESGQRFGAFGIKPDILINFLAERTSL